MFCHAMFNVILQNILRLTKSSSDKDIQTSSDYLRDKNTPEKAFNYRSNIISLYGAFEHFVEELEKEYMGELLSISNSFSGLNDCIKSVYLSKWKDLSSRLSYAKFSHITERQLISTLYDSFIQDKASVLPECFLPNGGNYKHCIVSSLFKSLGLTDIDSKFPIYPPISNWLQNNGLSDKNSDDQFEVLNDLVERRNEIAHGSESVSLLSDQNIIDISEFIKNYSLSLNSFLQDSLLSVIWTNMSSDKIRPVHIYKHAIAVFHISNIQVQVGEQIILMRPKGVYPKYSYVKVLEIHKEESGLIEKVDNISTSGKELVISIEFSEQISESTSFKFRT